jgi:hypothetical protein
MPTIPYSPLLITNRPELAQLIADCAPEVPLTVHSADTVPARTWASAPAVLVDAQSVAAVRERGFPTLPHLYLITDAFPEPQVWTEAVKLGARRVAQLPDAVPWIAEAMRSAARGPAVIAVVGPGDGGTNTATTVAAALAIDALAHGRTAALVGIRPVSTPLERRVRPGLPITEPPPTHEGRLDVVIRRNRPAGSKDVAAVLANLRDDHDLIVIDAAAPPCPAGTAAIDEAHLVLVVAGPGEQHTPAMRALQGALASDSDRVRLLVLRSGTEDCEHARITATTAPGFAQAHTVELTTPADDPGLVSDSAFRDACAEVARIDGCQPDPIGNHHVTSGKDGHDVRAYG